MIIDLTTTPSKSIKTMRSLITLLNNVIETGATTMPTYANVWDNQFNCGLLTAMINEHFNGAPM